MSLCLCFVVVVSARLHAIPMPGCGLYSSVGAYLYVFRMHVFEKLWHVCYDWLQVICSRCSVVSTMPAEMQLIARSSIHPHGDCYVRVYARAISAPAGIHRDGDGAKGGHGVHQCSVVVDRETNETFNTYGNMLNLMIRK